MEAKADPVELQKALAGVDYPANREDLVRVALSHGAAAVVLNTLQRMPNRRYDSPSEVSQQLFW
ncbi:DUF2795 domain-containing protein [Sciscionella sediminilitoris]|uniref:DUF2795 domain-containing protein n=1 Tax=Sciscionella sediminilitoris TaxID=1445613 RepID=UPI0004DEFAF4|nr:DUF2795 domain-containing protein [Sciscionella sp. SE31]